MQSSSLRRGRVLMVATAVAAAIPTVLSAQGMVLVGHDVLHLPWLAAASLAGFCELALVVSALAAREATIQSRPARTDLAATWVFSLLSGGLSALHELTGQPHPDAGALLAAGLRIIAPLVACWLWHRIVAADAASTTAGRSIRELARDRALLAVAAMAHDLAEHDTPSRRAQARYRRSCVRLLHRYPDMTAADVAAAAARLIEMTDIPQHITSATEPARPATDTVPQAAGPERHTTTPAPVVPAPAPVVPAGVTAPARALHAIDTDSEPDVEAIVTDLLITRSDVTSSDVVAAVARHGHDISDRTARRWLARYRDTALTA